MTERDLKLFQHFMCFIGNNDGYGQIVNFFGKNFLPLNDKNTLGFL